jgi:hypothetical protein
MKRSVVFAVTIVMVVAGLGRSARADEDDEFSDEGDEGDEEESRSQLEVSVFPLDPQGLMKDQAAVPDLFSRAIGKKLRAKLAKTPISDLSIGFDCSIESAKCLDQILDAAGADIVVYGQIIWNDMTRKLKVVISSYDGTRKESKTYVLDSTDETDMKNELLSRADSFLEKISRKAGPPPEPPGRGGRRSCEDTLEGCPVDTEKPPSGITTGTYALIVGGGIATAVGVGFYVSALGIRNEIADHPADTIEDINAIKELETRGQLRTTVAYTAMIGGAALLTYGIVRALGERKPPPRRGRSDGDPMLESEDDSEVSISPLPGGAALVFTARFL